MTFYHGLGMFIFNMAALLVGAIIAYIIINDLEKKRKHKEYLEKLFGKKWKQDDDTN
jgi:predicted membrane protein